MNVERLLLEPAAGAVWRGSRVRVWDYTLGPWRQAVREMTAAFAALMPRGAPRLAYLPRPEVRCESLSQHARTRRGITVCNVDAAAIAPSVAITDAVSRSTDAGEFFVHVTIKLSRGRAPEMTPLCHEFMHALTDITDQPDRPYPETSCVWGDLMVPGAVDRAFIHRVYQSRETGNG